MIKGIQAAYAGGSAYFKKVVPKIWSATKKAPGEVRKYTTDAFSKMHQSNQYRKASDAINTMKFVTLGEVGKKFTTKTGIGISAGVAGGTVGYVAGKKKNKRYG